MHSRVIKTDTVSLVKELLKEVPLSGYYCIRVPDKWTEGLSLVTQNVYASVSCPKFVVYKDDVSDDSDDSSSLFCVESCSPDPIGVLSCVMDKVTDLVPESVQESILVFEDYNFIREVRFVPPLKIRLYRSGADPIVLEVTCGEWVATFNGAPVIGKLTLGEEDV